MTSRQAIPKALRFEVFKRDAFTCQYCGRKAPEVVLHCDHVVPVVAGGATDILNLITSCIDCNLGKGGRLLSDHAALAKQHQQLDELQERREQLEMMIRWRDELQRQSVDALAQIEDRLVDRGGYLLNDIDRARLRRWLNQHGAADLLKAIDDAFDNYLEHKDGVPTAESFNRAFGKIPAFASIARQEREKPYIRRLIYIQGIIRKRAGLRRYNCIEYLEHLHLCGMPLDDMAQRARKIRKLEEFERPCDEWLAAMGKPF